MDRKSELENEISNIWEIFINANECFHYSFYLHKPDTQDEFDYLNKSNDLQYIRHVMWRMAIIELSKLFSGSKTRDRYNIQHLIGKLKKDGNFGNIGISDETLNKWETEIEKNKEIINSILILRDKIYAHTDSDKTKYLNTDLSFKQIEFLLKIVEVIIRDIHSSVFDAYADVETVVFDRKRFNIVKVLAEEEKNRIQRLLDEFS
jgi:hypothetical protein